MQTECINILSLDKCTIIHRKMNTIVTIISIHFYSVVSPPYFLLIIKLNILMLILIQRLLCLLWIGQDELVLLGTQDATYLSW